MARHRQVILVSGDRGPDGPQPLGTLREILTAMAPFNTAPDGSGRNGLGESPGLAILHGPGMVVEVPAATDEVAQVMVTITDDEFAWPILAAMCRQQRWGMMDPDSGRVFSAM